ncbi:hypothetical protein BN1723_019476, partial [Verticillium longisporum]
WFPLPHPFSGLHQRSLARSRQRRRWQLWSSAQGLPHLADPRPHS